MRRTGLFLCSLLAACAVAPLELPAGPTDVRASLQVAPPTTSLRGQIHGDAVLLRCACLARPLLVTPVAGRFGLDGLPAGDYTAEIRHVATTDTCRGRLAPDARTALLQGHIVVEQQETPPAGPFESDMPPPSPCEFVPVPPARPDAYDPDLGALWDPPPTP